MRKFSLLIFLLISLNGFCQTIQDYLDYDWSEKFNPADFQNTELEADEEAIVVLDRSVLSYKYVSTRNGYGIALCRTNHLVYRIKSESAIEKMNRIYLSSRNGSCTLVKARTINKEGNTTTFDQDKLKEIELEGSGSYKILAIPGIEQDSWVEIVVSYQWVPSNLRFLIDHPFNTRKAEVIVRSLVKKKLVSLPPEVPELKGYNGFERVPEMETGELTVYQALNIQGSSTEKYMHEYAEEPRVDFVRKQSTWGGLKEWLYNRIFNSRVIIRDRMSISAKKKIFEEIGIDNSTSYVEKLKKIDRFVKEKIALTESSDPNFGDEKKIIDSRVANELGMLRIFRLLLITAEIDFEVYLLTDKEYLGVDREFPFTLGLNEVVFYIPLLEMYALPANRIHYAGKIPAFLGGSDGLKLEEVNESSVIVTIPYAKKEDNYEGTFSTISFDLDDEITKIEKTKKFYGDRAIRSRGYLQYADEADKREYLDDLMISELEETTSTPIKLTNESIHLNFDSKDTLYFESTLTTESLLTPISNGYLLSFPKVIGKQTSFYETGERVHNLFIGRSIVYRHEIVVNVPEGYELLDFENHRKSASCKDTNGRVFASFEANAILKGNQLIIAIDEFYEEGHFPKTLVPEYQKVINAAYEFYTSTSRLAKKD